MRVAASDAYQASKDAADFVCDGTDDQVEINQAIELIFVAVDFSQGRVLLSEGHFSVGAPILVHAGTTLLGMGIEATFITKENGNDSDGIVAAWGTATSYFYEIKELTLDGNKAFCAAGAGVRYDAVQGDYADLICVNVRAHDWNEEGFFGSGDFGEGYYQGCIAEDLSLIHI